MAPLGRRLSSLRAASLLRMAPVDRRLSSLTAASLLRMAPLGRRLLSLMAASLWRIAPLGRRLSSLRAASLRLDCRIALLAPVRADAPGPAASAPSKARAAPAARLTPVNERGPAVAGPRALRLSSWRLRRRPRPCRDPTRGRRRSTGRHRRAASATRRSRRRLPRRLRGR